MTGTKSTVFDVSACMLLAGSIVFGRQQDHELSGIHGIPDVMSEKGFLDVEITHDTRPTYQRVGEIRTKPETEKRTSCRSSGRFVKAA